LICPGGGHYCGSFNADNEPHGPGTLQRSDGSEAARGDWTNGRLFVGGARDAAGRLQGAASEWSASGLFEGEFVDGVYSGLGVKWDHAGKMRQCGQWFRGLLVKSCAVPRSKIRIGDCLTDAGPSPASALCLRLVIFCPPLSDSDWHFFSFAL
jgi:hypothetical protein